MAKWSARTDVTYIDPQEREGLDGDVLCARVQLGRTATAFPLRRWRARSHTMSESKP